MKSGVYTLSLHLLSVLVVGIVILPGANSSSPLRHNNEKVNRRQTRSACRLFVWDGMSASRYHVCKRLLRDNVYEGLGGKKFVRIRPRSVLGSLYPLSRHGPDRCLICGRSFRDHLTSRWFPRLYTPYDLYLDDVRKGASRDGSSGRDDGVDSDGEGEEVRSVSRWFGRRAVGSKNTVVEPEMTSLADDGRDGPARFESGPLAYHRKYILGTLSNDRDDICLSEDYEMRLVNKSDRYWVPKKKEETNFFKAFILNSMREIVLWDMDALLHMQYMENKSNE